MSDPKFVSPTIGVGISYDGLAANWSLQTISPCINAGDPDTTGLQLPLIDLAGSNRILMGNIDIGAYEFDVSVNTFDANTLFNSDLFIFPNPTNENINIVLKNLVFGNLSLKITNVLGQIVYSENTESVSSFYSASINISNFKDGIYSLIISDNSGKTYSSLIVKK